MTWINPVVWQEGMFLRAQHFQQQSRWTEAQARARLRATGPWWWGVSELRVDAEKLDIGQFAVAAAQGLFPDGAPFSIPGDAEPPEALNLDERARRQVLSAPLEALLRDRLAAGEQAILLLNRRGYAAFVQCAEGHVATCPHCSAKRKRFNQRRRCLGVWIDDRGVRFRCFHCGFSKARFYDEGERYDREQGTNRGTRGLAGGARHAPAAFLLQSVSLQPVIFNPFSPKG